ncbi:MAG: NUDIX domain-containing protein [Prevotellaceae bacterium]|nr:NUDIX domain-containing protein [Prevotellaceae bacterium]
MSQKMDNKKELFPIVDESGNVTGSISRGEAHNGSKVLHPVVHLHVFNSNGDLYLQKRPDWKDIQPGKWDTATGGHVDYGEDVESALKREVREELGITGFTPIKLGNYVFESNVEKEYVNVFKTVFDGEIYPSDKELNGGRFWSKKEIEENMGKNIFTPNFEHEYNKFFS